jgi:hypothetical protein
MRLFLTMLFLGWAGAVSARPEESDCRLVRLSAQELTRIRVAARADTEIPLERRSIHTCRHRRSDSFTVAVDTAGAPQPDGSEHWQRLTCTSDFRRVAPWRCEVYADVWTLEIATAEELAPVFVDFPKGMNPTEVHRVVQQAFLVLRGPAVLGPCRSNDETPKLVSDLGGTPSPVDLQALLRAGDGRLSLSRIPGGFALSHAMSTVEFSIPAEPDGAARVVCAYEEEIVVTS